ncbi:TetR/AcrR family transcriptional regulator [Microbacterium sp. ASV49]|uniref:TetR/AcrR family transcriptional regulator n=1 Tax=Microbacterium candidum TaxID=3041922 RepID=A0ABT7MUC3_9MICO|nr:TetR/AcrR family transcriptional regulator [Microbacterium sp. ASV49]MDL9978047.1 TetR/AcrR family transcriptional regulator [Microbacterium sp. ASV49]
MLTEAAIRVMCREGVIGATTRAIATEAGVPLGTIHYAFRSKAELFEQVIDAIADHTIRPVEDALARGVDPEKQLLGALRGYADHVRDFSDETRLTYELMTYVARVPELADVAKLQYDRYMDDVGRHLEDFASRNALEWTVPFSVVQRYLASVLEGAELQYLNDADDADVWAILELAGRHVLSLARRKT